jgi:hypothetical protein
VRTQCIAGFEKVSTNQARLARRTARTYTRRELGIAREGYMKLRVFVLGMVIVCMLGLAAFASACGDDNGGNGGGDTPTVEETEEPSGGDDTPEPTDEPGEPSASLEEYFQGLDAAENVLRSGQASSAETFETIDDTTPPDELIAAIEEAKNVIDEFAASLQDLVPPPDAAVAHEETIAAFQVVSGILSDAVGVVEGGGTAQDVATLLNSQEAADAETALKATCNALQQMATDNGIDVDLSCSN